MTEGFNRPGDVNAKSHGLDKCPRCGSAEIVAQQEKLFCTFCRFSWVPGGLELHTDQGIDQLRGTYVASGAQDITSSKDTISIKCQGCGAEVVIHTDMAYQARCQWCRQLLSINNQLPNGAVPDMVLPFTVTNEQASKNIDEFVKKRRFWLRKDFLEQFQASNVLGVYMPYMVVDVNSHMWLVGEGEHQTNYYYHDKKAYYDADVYHIRRDFDMTVNDLTLESSTKYDTFDQGEQGFKVDGFKNTNNVINTVLPFDTENAVQYNANYLRGFNSVRRDRNIVGVNDLLRWQMLSIGRENIRSSLQKMDRGVKWLDESVAIRGSRWISMYLPIWLYSFVDPRKATHEFTHYIAVNGRTGETMGSTPVNWVKLVIATLLSFVFSAAICWPIGLLMLVGSSNNDSDSDLPLVLFALPFVIAFLVGTGIYRWCRNFDKSHSFEKESEVVVTNLQGDETKINERHGLSSEHINGRNDNEPRERVKYFQMEPDG